MVLPLPAVRPRRPDWLQQAIVSGFIATAVAAVALVGAYAVALQLGQAHSANILGQWLYGLAHNRITTRAIDTLYGALLLHATFGLLWAGIYAYDAEPRLSRSGRLAPWQRGLLFSLGPWLLSIIVLLPLLGGGFLGLTLHAGPLPVIGNFVVHAIYGIVLGVMYNLTSGARADADGRAIDTRNASERGAALGIAAGAIVGGVAGLGIGLFTTAGGGGDAVITGPWQLFVFGAALGAAAGTLLGSMAGLTDVEKPRR